MDASSTSTCATASRVPVQADDATETDRIITEASRAIERLVKS